MTITRLTFEKAEELLDEFIQTKAVHNAQAVLRHMREMLNTFAYATVEDQQDFANKCSNFDKYVTRNGISSIGRKQFERWWETETGIDLVEDDIGCDLTYIDLEKHTYQPPAQEPFTYSKEFVEAVLAENKELKSKLKDIAEIVEGIKWGV